MSGAPATKTSSEGEESFVEHNSDLGNTEPKATYIPRGAASNLSPEHQDYLMKRYGTLELDPIPGPGGADPYNWPQWKVSIDFAS